MYHVEQPLLGNVPPLRFRDGIHDVHKEKVSDRIKEVKCINQELFNSLDKKIKNSNKSAIELARGTAAHREHVTNEPMENCYELLGEIAPSHLAQIASPRG